MKTTIALLSCLVGVSLALALEVPAKARWIWFPEDEATFQKGSPPGTNYFVRVLKVDAQVRSAQIRVFSGGTQKTYVNGTLVGQSLFWHHNRNYDMTQSLRVGENVVAVEAVNLYQSPPYKGPQTISESSKALLVHGIIALEDGGRIEFVSDAAWKTARVATAGWLEGKLDSSWVIVKDFGEPGPKVKVPWAWYLFEGF
ncbi:MAG: hypothetical protein HY360_14990 [Verrucomicrobia bacterium]|nr:hypothetical protein [Verrucomicrobiota bacterium]